MSSGRQFEVSPYTHTVEFRVERCDIYCVEVQVHRVRSRVLVENRLLAQAPSGLSCFMSVCWAHCIPVHLSRQNEFKRGGACRSGN